MQHDIEGIHPDSYNATVIGCALIRIGAIVALALLAAKVVEVLA